MRPKKQSPAPNFVLHNKTEQTIYASRVGERKRESERGIVKVERTSRRVQGNAKLLFPFFLSHTLSLSPTLFYGHFNCRLCLEAAAVIKYSSCVCLRLYGFYLCEEEVESGRVKEGGGGERGADRERGRERLREKGS